MAFLTDDFATVGSGNNLSGDTANTWAKNVGSGHNANFLGDSTGGISSDSTGAGSAQYDCTDKLPASADYTIECDIIVKSVTGNSTGVEGRSNGSGNAQSSYRIAYRPFHGCLIYRNDSGALTVLGTSNTGTTDPAPGSTIHLKLDMKGSTLTATVTGAMTGNWIANDNTYTAPGKVGVFSEAGVTDTTGPHIDNVVATNPPVSVAAFSGATHGVIGSGAF